jgi:hypothetical protein
VYLYVIAEKKTGTQWKPGQSGNPNGRPPKTREDAVLNELKARVPPGMAVDTILELMNHPTSWRARLAGTELYFYYTVGKPPQYMLHGMASTPDEWLQALRGGDDEADS